jgi:ribonuclease H2 subunit A
VSAASIAAKVTRDNAISQWEWETPSLQLSKEFGSGYPSDPRSVIQYTSTKRKLTTYI